MSKKSTFVAFIDSSLRAIKEPWKYKTSHVATSLTLTTGAVLVRVQPSLGKPWTISTWILAISFMSVFFFSSFGWLTVAKKVINSQKRYAYQYLLHVVFNLLWIVPNYLLLKVFAPDPIPPVPAIGGRIVIALFLLQLVWTSISNQISRELLAKESLVEELSAQRAMIIDADEATRELVSKYLHNNLQSGLVVITHQIRESMKDLPVSTKSRFQSIVDELEIMREVELRDASKALSPNLDVLTAEALLSPLVEMYARSMQVKVESNQVDYTHIKPVSLAIYRICEQVLLNAAVHGKATTAQISLKLDGKGQMIISIDNDGLPLSSKSTRAGTGSAIIDTWVSSLQGTWQLRTSPNNMTTFEAELAIS
jgi:signal transduction histidine kinase